MNEVLKGIVLTGFSLIIVYYLTRGIAYLTKIGRR